MYFNGFTLLLMILSVIIGIIAGIKIEQSSQFYKRDNWLNGETVEDRMKRDGWQL